MKVYLISLAAGLLVGVIYAVINVRSPAPPAIALIGLLGMLIGEQVPPIVKRLMGNQPVSVSWFRQECAPKITGVEPIPKETSSAAASQPGDRV